MNLESIVRGEFVINAAYGILGLAVFIVARMILQEQETRAAQDNMDDRDRKPSSGLVGLTRPFFTQYIVPMVRGKAFWDNKRRDFRRLIISAGLKEELTPDEFIAFKFFLIVFFPLVGGILKAMDMLDVSALTVLGSGVAGWFYPNFWANGRVARRQKDILKAMPFIVDLLALSTEAGLDFVGAIGKVCEKAVPSPLVEELGQMLKEIKVGSSRQEALREMSLRINMKEVSSFVAILISADQMGASIGKTLRQQSEQIRNARIIAAEKAGAAASQKVLLPMVIFILPCVFIMIFGPFVLETLNQK